MPKVLVMTARRYLIISGLLFCYGCEPRISSTGDKQQHPPKVLAHDQKSGVPKTLDSWNGAPPGKPIIKGTDKYVQQINKALTLLEDRSPASYRLVCAYVGIIKESPKSHMDAWTTPPTFCLSMKSAMYSVTWCAADLVHDAYHSKQFYDYVQRFGHPVARLAWTGTEAEKACNAVQLKAMREIGAPAHEIKHSESQDGTHYDKNNNGVYDTDDYDQADW